MSTNYRTLRRAVDDVVAAEDLVSLARQKLGEAEARLGQALRWCREARGLSLRNVAKRVKLSAPYLSDVERGRRSISTGNLEVLMGIVGSPLSTMEMVQAIQDAAKNAHKADFRIGAARRAPPSGAGKGEK